MLKRVFFAVTAAVSIANIVKTSLGPVGLDKMLVDEVGVSDNYTYLYAIIFNTIFVFP